MTETEIGRELRGGYYPWELPQTEGPQCVAGGVRNGPDGPGGTEHYWSCTTPGTVTVDGKLLCEDHAGERGYGPKQEEYGFDPDDNLNPDRAKEREQRLREELDNRTRQWDRIAKDYRTLTAEVVAGLSTTGHHKVTRGGLPFCECGLSLAGGDSSGSFITHALAVLNAAKEGSADG